jgi:hypothetical protein
MMQENDEKLEKPEYSEGDSLGAFDEYAGEDESGQSHLN